MTKNDLISAIAEKGGYSKKEAEQALAAVTETITEALVKGEKVSIVGFGAFEVRDRAARILSILQQRSLSMFLQRRFLHSRQARLLKRLWISN